MKWKMVHITVYDDDGKELDSVSVEVSDNTEHIAIEPVGINTDCANMTVLSINK